MSEAIAHPGATTAPAEVRQRMDWIDYAKGMTIILVVFRHSLVGLNRSGYEVPRWLYLIQEFVLNFRMPVFFMLSGLFLVRSLKKKPITRLAMQKVNTLLYPYLLWTIIFISLQIFLSRYTNSNRTIEDYKYIVTQPRNLDHMWYLLALFNTSVLYLLLSPLLGKKPYLHLVIAFGFHLLAYVLRDYSFVSDFLYHYIFLLIGTLVSDHLFKQKEFNVPQQRKYLLLLLPFFIAGQLTWLHFADQPNFWLQIPFLLIILVDCLFFYFLCINLYQANIFRRLSYVGKHSLYIYILHLLVISMCRIVAIQVFGHPNIYVLVAIGLILGITIPIIVYNAGKPFGIDYLFSLEKKQGGKNMPGGKKAGENYQDGTRADGRQLETSQTVKNG